ncbi:hypothetical protein Ddc_18411 [Ditylenchus destructor]|nr:hypothetical protein Ddc_18411 [Ditylenchus destructor]
MENCAHTETLEHGQNFNWHSILERMQKNPSSRVQVTFNNPMEVTDVVKEIERDQNLNVKQIFSVGGTNIFTVTEKSSGFDVIMLPNCGVGSDDSTSSMVQQILFEPDSEVTTQ